MSSNADDSLQLLPCEQLFVAICRLAIRDAQNTSDTEAVEFLNVVYPKWQSWVLPGSGASPVFKQKAGRMKKVKEE